MLLWFIFALLSVITLAGSELAQKISLTQKITISAVTNNFFVWLMQGTAGLVLALIFKQMPISLPDFEWFKLGLVAVVYFLGGTFFYTSYKSNSPSISIVLGSISVVVSTTLGIVFFNESTGLTKFLGIGLILAAIVVANVTKKLKFDTYNMFALLGGMFFGIAYTLDKSFAIEIPPILYVGMLCISVALVSIIVQFRRIVTEASKFKIKHYYPMIMSAAFGTSFNFFTFQAYAHGGNVGVVDALNNSSVFLVIVLEIFLLKDRTNLIRKVIASLIVLIGIILLARIQ